MFMADTVRSILRRWYIFATGAILSLALGWTAFQTIPTTYEASGSVVMMPSEVTVGDTGNPFLYLGGMTDAADVLIRRANAPAVREDLLDRFDGAEYTISRDLSTESPLVVVTVSAPTAAMATELRDIGLTTIEMNLSVMQDELDIEPALRLSLRSVVVEQAATENSKTAIQLALVAIAAGLMGTFMLTGIADGILTRRRERKDRKPLTKTGHLEPNEPPAPAVSGVSSESSASGSERFSDEVHPATVQRAPEHLAESRS